MERQLLPCSALLSREAMRFLSLLLLLFISIAIIIKRFNLELTGYLE
jgi:hypothetical protein